MKLIGIKPNLRAKYSSFNAELFFTIFTSLIAFTGNSNMIILIREFAKLKSIFFRKTLYDHLNILISPVILLHSSRIFYYFLFLLKF